MRVIDVLEMFRKNTLLATMKLAFNEKNVKIVKKSY